MNVSNAGGDTMTMILAACLPCVQERLFDQSDAYRVHVCGQCGLIAVANLRKNQFYCTACKNTTGIVQVRGSSQVLESGRLARVGGVLEWGGWVMWCSPGARARWLGLVQLCVLKKSYLEGPLSGVASTLP